jgi:uncharacterized membrane protein YhaH (DUF805 family)
MQEQSIFEYFKQTLTKNYANFEGRARRKEFWSFTLVSFIISIVLTAIDTTVLNTPLGENRILVNIFNLAFLGPQLLLAQEGCRYRKEWMDAAFIFLHNHRLDLVTYFILHGWSS